MGPHEEKRQAAQSRRALKSRGGRGFEPQPIEHQHVAAKTALEGGEESRCGALDTLPLQERRAIAHEGMRERLHDGKRGQRKSRGDPIRKESGEPGGARHLAPPQHHRAAQPIACDLLDQRKEKIRPEEMVRLAGVVKERPPFRLHFGDLATSRNSAA
jgi:hypothetical protein